MIGSSVLAKTCVCLAVLQGVAATTKVDEEPRVLLESLDGSVERRALKGFECTDPRTLKAWIVRFEGVAKPEPLAASSDRAHVELASGDHLYGRVRNGRAELFDVEVAGGLRIGVAVDELKSLVFPVRCNEFASAAPEAPEEGDRLYRVQRGGLDRIDGGVEEFTTDGVRFHGVLGSKLIPWSEVAALFVEGLSDSEPSAANATSVAVVVDFTDQSRVRGKLDGLDSEGCRLRTQNGERLNVPVSVIAAVTIDDGKLAYLSSIAPAEALPSKPWGDDEGMSWPPRFDRSVNGAALRAGGRTWSRGIGVLAPSRLRWKLGGKWKELRGSVAIDDEVLRQPTKGSVVFRIHADSKKVWESPVVRGGDPPIAVTLRDLGQVDELVLEVDMIADASRYMGDHADWLDLVLVR